jgi:hypothetical protein
MLDHQNEFRTTNITPATMRETKNLNEQIIDQFEEGEAGLGHKDHHFLDKPLAHVLGYNLDHKSQWLESIALARIWFVHWHKVESPSIRHQREFMASWLSNGMGPP